MVNHSLDFSIDRRPLRIQQRPKITQTITDLGPIENSKKFQKLALTQISSIFNQTISPKFEKFKKPEKSNFLSFSLDSSRGKRIMNSTTT